jgi:hypothetical protein
MNLEDHRPRVHDRATLASFVKALVEDLANHPGSWANADLPSFLEAMAGWIEDMDGYYENAGVPFDEEASWSVLADVLHAARHYE